MQSVHCFLVAIFAGCALLRGSGALSFNANMDVCHFPRKHSYPCEVHAVTTADGYVLSMIRIAHKVHATKKKRRGDSKPVALLMHGILWSSNNWLINDPNEGLAFMLADAGYDVWLPNVRGNVYSKKHISKSISSTAFWDFSWHEIAIYDVPAVIDYILGKTNQSSLHYVGHSQGTTVFFVWLSAYPKQSNKIKTSHLMAPVTFMDHMSVQFSAILGDIIGQPTPWIESIRAKEVLGRIAAYDTLPQLCARNSPFLPLCENFYFNLLGYSPHTNTSLFSEFASSYPCGCSLRQIIHYLQEYTSGHFRQFDYGLEQNLQIYNRPMPPDYNLKSIKTSTPLNLYYGDNDVLVSPIDVHRLAKILGDRVELHKVHRYSHLDFVMAKNVKEVINDCVLAKMETYEGKPYKGNPCCNLSSRWHCGT